MFLERYGIGLGLCGCWECWVVLGDVGGLGLGREVLGLWIVCCISSVAGGWVFRLIAW